MSIFPTKILLATDGSKDAELAATTAADLANATNSELHVMTVAGGRAYHMESEEVVEDLRQRAQRVIDEQVRRIEQSQGNPRQGGRRTARPGDCGSGRRAWGWPDSYREPRARWGAQGSHGQRL